MENIGKVHRLKHQIVTMDQLIGPGIAIDIARIRALLRPMMAAIGRAISTDAAPQRAPVGRQDFRGIDPRSKSLNFQIPREQAFADASAWPAPSSMTIRPAGAKVPAIHWLIGEGTGFRGGDDGSPCAFLQSPERMVVAAGGDQRGTQARRAAMRASGSIWFAFRPIPGRRPWHCGPGLDGRIDFADQRDMFRQAGPRRIGRIEGPSNIGRRISRSARIICSGARRQSIIIAIAKLVRSRRCHFSLITGSSGGRAGHRSSRGALSQRRRCSV